MNRVSGEEAENALIDFIRHGKGFVVFHASSVCFPDWLDFQKLVGATWKEDQTDHGDIHTFNVVINDKEHPITVNLENFEIRDELWHRMNIQPEAHVLCQCIFQSGKWWFRP